MQPPYLLCFGGAQRRSLEMLVVFIRDNRRTMNAVLDWAAHGHHGASCHRFTTSGPKSVKRENVINRTNWASRSRHSKRQTLLCTNFHLKMLLSNTDLLWYGDFDVKFGQSCRQEKRSSPWTLKKAGTSEMASLTELLHFEALIEPLFSCFQYYPVVSLWGSRAQLKALLQNVPASLLVHPLSNDGVVRILLGESQRSQRVEIYPWFFKSFTDSSLKKRVWRSSQSCHRFIF